MDKFYGYVKDSLQLINASTLDYKCDFTNAFSDFSLQSFNTLVTNINLTNTLGKNNIRPIYEESDEIYV